MMFATTCVRALWMCWRRTFEFSSLRKTKIKRVAIIQFRLLTRVGGTADEGCSLFPNQDKAVCDEGARSRLNWGGGRRWWREQKADCDKTLHCIVLQFPTVIVFINYN